MSTIGQAEAELVLRKATRTSSAKAELIKPVNRLPGLLLGFLPVILMLFFGEFVVRTLSVPFGAAWAIVGLWFAVVALGVELSIVQRKVAALYELVQTSERGDA